MIANNANVVKQFDQRVQTALTVLILDKNHDNSLQIEVLEATLTRLNMVLFHSHLVPTWSLFPNYEW